MQEDQESPRMTQYSHFKPLSGKCTIKHYKGLKRAKNGYKTDFRKNIIQKKSKNKNFSKIFKKSLDIIKQSLYYKDNENRAAKKEGDKMSIPEIILNQLGGNKFVVMTGSKNFVGDGYTLRMTLARNASKANRLEITLDADDTYTMRFFKYTPGGWKVNHKTGTVTDKPEKIEEVKTYKMIYCDQLQELFTEVTHLYTHL